MAARAYELVQTYWGKQTKQRRKSLGLTQVGLAERAGYPQSTISEIETGKYRAFTPELVLRLAVALDADPAELYPWPQGIGMIAEHELKAAS